VFIYAKVTSKTKVILPNQDPEKKLLGSGPGSPYDYGLFIWLKRKEPQRRYIHFVNLVWEFQRQTPNKKITQPPTGFFLGDLP